MQRPSSVRLSLPHVENRGGERWGSGPHNTYPTPPLIRGVGVGWGNAPGLLKVGNRR